MGAQWSDKRHNYGLFAFYGMLGGLSNVVVHNSNKPSAPLALLTLTSTTWMGFILAISGMEAWVKFKAPLMPRHVGFDVGRHVFSALSAVECAFACSQLCTLYANDLFSKSEYSSKPIVLSCMVFVQLFLLSPKLENLGKIIIAEEGSASECKTKKASKAFSSIQQEVTKKNLIRPSKFIHLSYVIMELVKVVILGNYAYNTASNINII